MGRHARVAYCWLLHVENRILARRGGTAASLDVRGIEAFMSGEREIAKMFAVPEYLIGLPTPWWRRWVQKWTRRG